MDIYSLSFFVFLFIVIGIYYFVLQRFRWVVLLGASYYFYGTFKMQYVLLIAASTIIAYCTALLIQKNQEKSVKKKYLFIGVIFNLGLLFVLKYYNFFSNSLASILSFNEIPHKSHLLRLVVPVGISFVFFSR